MVPVDKQTEQPVFATYNNGHDFWPLIVEKAFAKIYGNYNAIEFGWASEVIYAITGAPVFNVMRPSGAEEKETSWQELKSSVEMKFVLWANNDKGVHGLSSSHAYAVLGYGWQKKHGRLLHVYNPWSHNYYEGALKDKRGDDGSFWITAEEFWEHFDHVEVAEVRQGYREISLELGNRFRRAKAVLSFRMESNRPFTVSVSTLNERFFKGTECESITDQVDIGMSAWVKPTGGDPVKHWWRMDNDAQFMRFPGKAGDCKVVVEVNYPEKNWDSRVRIYAHEADLGGDNVPELTELE